MSAAAVPEPAWTRVRLVFGKRGGLRFLGQLDIGRTLERSLRRTGLPVRYTAGFNPRVRMSFPCAAATGMASSAELVEVQVAAGTTPAAVAEALRADLPADLPVFSAEAVPEGERLRVVEAAYRVVAVDPLRPLPPSDAVAALLARDEVRVERRGRTLDLRPLLLAAERGPDGALALRIAFAASGATARPADVLAALGAADVPVEEERIALVVLHRRGAVEEERRHGA